MVLINTLFGAFDGNSDATIDTPFVGMCNSMFFPIFAGRCD